MLQKYLSSLVERILIGALLVIGFIASGPLPFVSTIVASVACFFDVLGALAMMAVARAEARLYDQKGVMFDEVYEYFRDGLEKAGHGVNADLGLDLLHLFFDCADRSYVHARPYPVLGGVAFLLHFALSLIAALFAKWRELLN